MNADLWLADIQHAATYVIYIITQQMMENIASVDSYYYVAR